MSGVIPDDMEDEKNRHDGGNPNNDVVIEAAAPQGPVNEGRAEPVTLSFEGVLDIVGGWGWWQMKIFLLASFSGCCTGIHHLISSFISEVPAYWCHLPTDSLYTYEEMKEMFIPGNDTCSRYAYGINETGHFKVNKNLTIPCIHFDFNQTEVITSIPTEFELVCDEGASLVPAIQSVYMMGLMFGSPILGAMSDKVGRRKTILISSLIFILAGFTICIGSSIESILFLRFFLGFAAPGIYSTSYVLALEVVGKKWRSKVGGYFNIPFAIGYLAIPLAGYYIREWRLLQFLLCLPSLFLVVTWYCLPESPRWLISNGKIEAAENVLIDVAETNGNASNVPSNFRSGLQSIYDGEREQKTSDTCVDWKQYISIHFGRYWRVFKSPKIMIRLAILAFCWFTIALTYYGLAFYSKNVDTSKFRFLAINALMEIPAYVLTPFLIDQYGRKPVFIGLLLTCGSTLIAGGFMDTGYLLETMVYFGKFVSCIAYALIYLLVSEMMPTSIRTYAIGMASMVGRVGSAIAPIITDILGGEHRLSCYVFGGLIAVGGFLAIFLPETRNKKLPDRVEDA